MSANGALVGRRGFIGGMLSAGAWATGALPTVAVADGVGWKEAFRGVGFDPDAPGCDTFIVIGDPHVPCGDDSSSHLSGLVGFWNAMRPRPGFVFSMGDQVSTVTGQMGDRLTMTIPEKRMRASADIRLFRSYFDRLELPFHHTIGNHDSYPGEVDAEFYGSHFPGWKPYGRFDFGGAVFMNWNGGHDGHIDRRQREWILDQMAKIPDDRPLFIATHYPDLGVGRVDGYGIALMVREALDRRRGETWLLAGHNHVDGFVRYSLPGGGRLAVVTHVRESGGWWIYGLRDGGVAARVLVSPGGGVRIGTTVEDAIDRGALRLPFEGLHGMAWSHFIGDADDGEYRVSVGNANESDAGHWLFYIGEVVYRLPLKKVKGAGRFGIFGKMWGHRRTKEREPLSVSSDNANWIPVPVEWKEAVGQVYIFDIPVSLQSADWLYVKIGGFGFGCDSSLGGFALMTA